eukprot:357397-Chlamydomonas_euryale.AAC.1
MSSPMRPPLTACSRSHSSTAAAGHLRRAPRPHPNHPPRPVAARRDMPEEPSTCSNTVQGA